MESEQAPAATEQDQSNAVDERAAAKEVFDRLKAERNGEPQGQPEVAAPTTEPAENQLPTDFEQRLRWDNHDDESVEFQRSRPHDVALDYYQRVKQRQERTDALYRDRQTLERAAAQRTQDESKPVEQQPAPKSLVDVLGESADLLDPKVVEALESYVDERTTLAAPPVEPQQDQFDPERAQYVDAKVGENKARLQGMYPGYRLDGAEWDALVSQANAEAKNDIYKNAPPSEGDAIMQRVFDMAFYRIYGAVPAMQETTTPSGPVTRNTAATSPSVAQPAKEMTEKERQLAIFQHLKRNPNDIDGSRASVGAPPLNLSPRFKQW